MSVNISEQFAKMGLGEKIILIAAPLLLIDSFLPWFDYDVAGGPTRSGWSGDLAILTILATLGAVAMGAQVAIKNFTTVQLPTLPQGLTWARIHLGLGAYVAFAVVIRLLVGESVAGFDADMAFGLWIAVILAAALVAGAFLNYQAEQKGNAPSM